MVEACSIPNACKAQNTPTKRTSIFHVGCSPGRQHPRRGVEHLGPPLLVGMRDAASWFGIRIDANTWLSDMRGFETESMRSLDLRHVVCAGPGVVCCGGPTKHRSRHPGPQPKPASEPKRSMEEAFPERSGSPSMWPRSRCFAPRNRDPRMWERTLEAP